MLNSKYAPIFALTTLGIIVLALLGWFLAVKPQVDQASAYSSDEDLVRGNIATVKADTAAIAQVNSTLAGAEDLSPALALNAPSRLDLPDFRARVSEATVSSGVELGSAEQEYGALVDGWEIPPALLPSTDLAKRFQSGPAPTTQIEAQPFTPVVTVNGEAQVRAEGLAMLPFTYRVVGTPQEVYDFLGALGTDDQQFFQVYEITMDALAEGATIPLGVSEPSDGDVLAEVIGALYLSNIDTTSLDEGPVAKTTVPSDSPFTVPAEDAPDQPGAN